MNAKELMEYGKANKDMFSSEMRAAFKKVSLVYIFSTSQFLGT